MELNTLGTEISQNLIDRFKKEYTDRKESKVIERTVTKNGILNSSRDLAADVESTPVFSIDLDTGDVANQMQSGRCWMFAALNTMRHDMKNQFKVPGSFELSQSYTFFWDKFEKSNWFYENIIKTAALDTDDRKVAFLLNEPQGDGGQWDMLCAIIEKYGVVPQSAFPETYNSSKSREFDTLLNEKLRKDAITLRELVNSDASDEQIQERKQKMLSEVYRMASYSFGQPPVKFDWEYRDDSKAYHREEGITPKEFFDKYIGWDLDEYISIINAPTADKPYDQTYTVEMLGNVVNGRQVKHLNLNMHDFKQAAINQLKSGESVWFGCDVGQHSEAREKGLLDLRVFAEDELFDIDISMSKAERLDYKESLMTHAMVLTGVDLVDGKPKKWKVENSWGKKVGEKGYMVMSDEWMDEYCYQVVVQKKFLTDAQRSAQSQEPTVLKPWDPMGSLAYTD
ncbi:aminopeptidase C [Pediococcus stilesii]|uniref:Aminopeptidase n=1 Tax=Pediococcus stilesii TaxID=331679 RepID=A0A0R2L3L1_9LACO|nr:aminopeptidase C [Pediococcus stilesii]